MNAFTSFGYGMQGANAALRDNAATTMQRTQASMMSDAAELARMRQEIARMVIAKMREAKSQPTGQQLYDQAAGMDAGALPGRPTMERMSGVQQYACGGHVKKFNTGGPVRRFNGIPDASMFDYQKLPDTMMGLTEAYHQFNNTGYADGGPVQGDAFSRVLAFATGGQVPSVEIEINTGGKCDMGEGSDSDAGEAENEQEDMTEGPAHEMGEGEAIPGRGRMVRGPGTGTSDSIPAMIDGQQPAALSNGEYVIPADIVQKYGVQFFDQLTEQERRNG